MDLEAKIKKFIIKAKRCSLEKTIRRNCVREKSSLRYYYQTDTTFKNVITRYRNAIKRDLKPEKAAIFLNHLNAGKIITNRINRKTALGVQIRRRRTISVPLEVSKRIIRQAIHMLSETRMTPKGKLVERSIAEIGLGLLLLTGRRMAEIFTGTFKKVNNNEMLFVGQLKTRGCENSRDKYVIPVLCNPDYILKAIAVIRDYDGRIVQRKAIEKPSDVNARVAQSMGLKVKTFFGFVDSQIKVKGLRKLYAAMAYQLYAVNEVYDKGIYYASVLGHSVGDTLTAESYKGYEVKGLGVWDIYDKDLDISFEHLDAIDLGTEGLERELNDL